MVGKEPRPPVSAGAHFVGVLFARKLRRGEAVADLHALDRVDAHQRARQLAVELAVDRRAPAGRNALGDDLDHRADRGAGFSHLVEMVGEARRRLGVGTEERIAGDLVPVPARAVDLQLAHLDQRAANPHPGHDLARDRAGGDARRRLARRGAPAAAIVANAVFGVVDVVGVAGTVLVLDVAVVFRALVDVFDEDGDRRAGRHLPSAALVDHHARQDARLVGFAPLRGEARGSRAAPVEIGLDVGDLERNQRRTAVDDAADSRPVAFAEGGDAEEMAETVVGHALRSARFLRRRRSDVKLASRTGERAAVGRHAASDSPRPNRSRSDGAKRKTGNRSSPIHVRLAIG